MSLPDLALDLQHSLHDSATAFGADALADMRRFVLQALPAMALKRPRTKLGQVLLQAEVPRYSLADCADFSAYKTHLWEQRGCALQPWDAGYPGATPRMSASNDGAGYWLDFAPAPNALHIAARGSSFRFYYFATHTLGDEPTESTVNLADRGLLLLRAQVEALRELAIRNVTKPVAMRDGYSGQPRNSTAAALHAQLLEIFEAAA
ncbi:hypothetical protein [Variovorax sp. HJSM1_2]|uniref:hypothetical protein n=1 Tax=Variovorax sp. HJSM1_2 TaxID=3366263 RepID=UPI003BE7ADEF